jgi:hypothetical protein
MTLTGNISLANQVLYKERAIPQRMALKLAASAIALNRIINKGKFFADFFVQKLQGIHFLFPIKLP